MENQQLIKKDRSANSYSKIFPWTFTDLVLDRVTKESLDNILVRNNFIALPYVGSKAATRLQVPMKNRRRGIWLSYIDYAGTLTVEYYNDNNLDDNHWQDSSYWLPYNTVEFQPASVSLSALAQEVFDWINSQITTAVKLNPEDLQKNSSGQIEEANRAYDTSTFSGLGYRILRKNIQSNKNILTQSMINMPNTIYEIRYDFDLNGATINLPANSVLQFVGGSIKNGTLNGSNTVIEASNVKIFERLNAGGSFVNSFIDASWFGAIGDNNTLNDTAFAEAIQFSIESHIYDCKVGKGTYLINDSIELSSNCSFGGYDSQGNAYYAPLPVIKSLNDSITIALVPPTSNGIITNVSIHDLGITHGNFNDNINNIGIGYVGEDLKGIQRCRFKNLLLQKNNHGFYFNIYGGDGFAYNAFESVNTTWNNCGFTIVGISSGSGISTPYINLNNWTNCVFSNNKFYGILLDTVRTTQVNYFVSCSIEANGSRNTETIVGYGVKLANTFTNGHLIFDSCYFESNYSKFAVNNVTSLDDFDYLNIGEVIISTGKVCIKNSIIANFASCINVNTVGSVILENNEIFDGAVNFPQPNALVVLKDIKATSGPYTRIKIYEPSNFSRIVAPIMEIGTIQIKECFFDFDTKFGKLLYNNYRIYSDSIIYVDSINGDDTYTGFSSLSPRKTLNLEYRSNFEVRISLLNDYKIGAYASVDYYNIAKIAINTNSYTLTISDNASAATSGRLRGNSISIENSKLKLLSIASVNLYVIFSTNINIINSTVILNQNVGSFISIFGKYTQSQVTVVKETEYTNIVFTERYTILNDSMRNADGTLLSKVQID